MLKALAGGPLVQARNFAVMTGVNAGITSVLKRIRGKEDVQSRFDFMNFIASIHSDTCFVSEIIEILLLLLLGSFAFTFSKSELL